MSKSQIDVKRVYDEASDSDGTRILVDGMWPRGVRKDAAVLDDWNKDVAPTAELRRWYGHDPNRYKEFAARYRDELDDRGDELDALLNGVQGGALTLLTATKDVEHSHAVVLAEVLRDRR